MISIRFDRDAVRVGDFLSGRVFWSAKDARRPRRILIAAVWETEGKSNAVTGVGRAMEFVPKGSEAMIPFRFMIPHEGPITFTGKLTGIVWKIKVRVELRGFDEFETLVFRVD